VRVVDLALQGRAVVRVAPQAEEQVLVPQVAQAAKGDPVRAPELALAELEAQIAERDRLDSTRAVAPLLQAEDAAELVTDGMAIEAVIEALVALFRERVPEEAWPGAQRDSA
jgi:cytidylate kinase